MAVPVLCPTLAWLEALRATVFSSNDGLSGLEEGMAVNPSAGCKELFIGVYCNGLSPTGCVAS